jgi:peptidoglycan/LPS O-acetylase OafA/YrhL
LDSTPPVLTSAECTAALETLFSSNSPENRFLLAVATESSSHPAGLPSLVAQPYRYAGGGLGSPDECPLETCLAGAAGGVVRRDSLTFAAVCMVPQCTAYDVAAADFVATAERALERTVEKRGSRDDENAYELGREYVTLLRRTAEINEFLGTGWTCGSFVVPFQYWPYGGPYCVAAAVLLLLSLAATLARERAQRRRIVPASCWNGRRCRTGRGKQRSLPASRGRGEVEMEPTVEEETTSLLLLENGTASSVISRSSLMNGHGREEANVEKESPKVTQKTNAPDDPFWSAFDVSTHLRRLVAESPGETACLDGLRTGSILWIVLGHCMAIESSSGAGYSNPSNFLPPTGLTATVPGQLLFSSRLAVDTFLTLSGFLVVYVLNKKLPRSSENSQRTVVGRYFGSLPTLLVARLVRILPLYAVVLGFYTQIAPHLGGGPFWHQWLGLLQPCRDYGWTNFLFVNNFWPADTAVTNTCFYHSWYLAVDMQFFAVAPLLVFWYQANEKRGMNATLLLFASSVGVTAYLSYVRRWSLNTFDGAAVARYDVEAYAKPHVRAQAYLAGMYVAMLLLRLQHRERFHRRRRWTARHRLAVVVALTSMAAVTFGTATGAYARRPCTYQEYPGQDPCGSSWSPTTTFLYTAFSRTVWIVAVAVLLYLCVGCSPIGKDQKGDRSIVGSILSWRCWGPMSQLSFGVYLIHPIVIFVWQLGDREKQVFRLLTFGMDYLAVCVVSYVAALLTAVTVEFPCAALWKNYSSSRRTSDVNRESGRESEEIPSLSDHSESLTLYGSTSGRC